jgi:phosphoribosyl 1,2-cyclic phosphodiesterase
LTGILITHEHSDHVQGLTALTAKLNVPIYCNRLTREALDQQVQGRADFRVFSTGSSFEVGELSVDSFSIPHDANDPVGFLVNTAFGKFGFLTDLGQATKLVLERVRGATALLLEANYDVKLLNEDSRRPWSVKQRIQSRHGHLSNDAAAGVAEEILSPELKQLFLGHLSRDCNTPELASAAVTNRLAGIGGGHVRVAVVSQETPSETCCFEADPSVAASAFDPAPAQVSSS